MSIDDMNVVYAFGQLNIHIQLLIAISKFRMAWLEMNNEGWKLAMIE